MVIARRMRDRCDLVVDNPLSHVRKTKLTRFPSTFSQQVNGTTATPVMCFTLSMEPSHLQVIEEARRDHHYPFNAKLQPQISVIIENWKALGL